MHERKRKMNRYEGFVGKVLDGRYRILELVGMGGMACVLKAQDLLMNRIVAIKILNDEYNGDEQAEARFIDESKAVAMLSNKNIVSVYDVAIYPDIKYIVMEYLDGITLREYLDNKGSLDWKEACIYTLQTLRALEHAHSKGIIHRDIKPQNVILTKNGDIKVTDFGIAKLPNSLADQTNEKAIGTVYYISPEQACGKETDYYSDIYSVGVMLYEAVTGTLPFTGETPMDVALKQVNDEPVNPRDLALDIPIGVSQIILKAMEKAPTERFQSAHSMAKAIEWVLRNPSVIFAMSVSSAEEAPGSNSTVISIDMIDTAEIVPYGDDEIADSLGKKHEPKPKKKVSSKAPDEKPAKKKKKKASRSMFPIVCGVSFSFLLVAVVLLFMVGYNAVTSFFASEEEPEYEYPNIVNTLYTEELRNNLRNGAYGAKFVIDEVVYENRDDIENNRIISTEPPAGHLSKPAEDGKFHFSQVVVNRSEKVFMPHLEGYTKVAAQSMLLNLNLKVEFIETSETDNRYYHSNQVLDTFPVAGSEVKVGDKVTVYICSKTNPTKTARLPDLIGLSEADAIKFAETYSLYKVIIEKEEVFEGDNTVIRQSIDPGTISPKDTELIVTIGVPMTAPLMPDIKGLTISEARALLDSASPFIYINMYCTYFTADESVRDYVTVIGEEFTSLTECANELIAFGCDRVYKDDGNGIIVSQSILPDTEITEVQYLEVIVVSFTEGGSEPDYSEPDTDVSVPDYSEPDIEDPWGDESIEVLP